MTSGYNVRKGGLLLMTLFNLTFRKHIITHGCHSGTEATRFQEKVCAITDSRTCSQFSKQIKFSGVYSVINEYIIETAKQVIHN